MAIALRGSRSWRIRIAILWVAGMAVMTVAVNARYADPDLATNAARDRALALDVDSASRLAGSRSMGQTASGVVGRNTQYLFDRIAERRQYAVVHPRADWGWIVLLSLSTAAALPCIFVLGWLGRRIAG